MPRPDRARQHAHGRKIRHTLATPAARGRAPHSLRAARPGEVIVGAGEELGAPGNQNIYGWLTGEDYNQDLDGQVAAVVYDEMRRGHAQTAAVLLMCKLRIKGATWRIEPASDDPQDVAIADFCTAALLDDDAMSTTWTQVLETALLKLDFGSSALEKVWTVDEHGALRLRKLAPRLPKTFYQWFEDPQTGDLATLRQYAPKNGNWQFLNIPREKLSLHIRQREGNNWFGISLLRAAYPHWWYIKQLYRIAAVSADREHQGIPIARLTEHYKATSAPLDKIEETLAGLRSYERAYLVQPHGVEYDWLVSKSTGERMQGLMLLIEHHNLMISRSVLQSFSAQGEQRHGSFGAAAVTYDVFQDAELGTAADLCGELTREVIKPLCEFNFDMTGRKTPKLVANDLGKVDTGALADSGAKLATAKILTMDDELEDYYRRLLGAPLLPEALRGRDRTQSTSTDPNNPDGNPPEPDPTNGKQPGRSKAPEVNDDSSQFTSFRVIGRDGRPLSRGYRELGLTFAREPNARERQVLALHEIPRRLDEEKARLAAALASLRREEVQAIAKVLAKKDARRTAAFTDLRPSQLPAPKTAAIKRAIRDAQDRVMTYGADQVVAELQRQGTAFDAIEAGRARFDAMTLAGSSPASNRKTAKSALVSSATTTADRLAKQWQSTALENAQRLRRSGLVGDAFVDAIIAELDRDSGASLTRAANEEVNEAFGLGRATQASLFQDDIETAVYSSVLDANTCGNCEELDGKEFIVGSDDYLECSPPYVRCDGRDQCRCVWLYIATGASAQ